MAIAYVGTAGPSISNTTTASTLLSISTGVMFPSNFFVGASVIRITLKGTYTTTGTPTLRITVTLNPTVKLQSAAQTMPANVATAAVWSLDAMIAILTTGSSGTTGGDGIFTYFGTVKTTLLGFEVPTTAFSLNTTIPNKLDVTAEWGTANASNLITANSQVIEVLNPAAGS